MLGIAPWGWNGSARVALQRRVTVERKQCTSDFEAQGGGQLLKDVNFCVLETMGDSRKFYWDPKLGEFKPKTGMPFKAGWSLLKIGSGGACL